LDKSSLLKLLNNDIKKFIVKDQTILDQNQSVEIFK